MKLTDKIKQQPAGKGCQPKTEKQAAQWAMYDELGKRWKFPRPLTPALIEKLSIALTGEPRGIPLKVWEEAIDHMNELVDIQNPYGFLRYELMRRLRK